MAGFQPPPSPVGPGPAPYGFAITPSDTVPLPDLTRYIYVGGTGDVAIILAGEASALTFKAVPVGTFMLVCASQVMATGTTATNLLGLY